MQRAVLFLSYWLPAILWMILIFYFSSEQRVILSDEFTINFVLFKTLHIVEYALLYFLLFRAFYLSSRKKSTKQQSYYLYPFLLSLLYAASDELHQALVPTRGGKIRDVVIDTAGILLMYTVIKTHIATVRKIL